VRALCFHNPKLHSAKPLSEDRQYGLRRGVHLRYQVVINRLLVVELLQLSLQGSLIDRLERVDRVLQVGAQ